MCIPVQCQIYCENYADNLIQGLSLTINPRQYCQVCKIMKAYKVTYIYIIVIYSNHYKSFHIADNRVMLEFHSTLDWSITIQILDQK